MVHARGKYIIELAGGQELPASMEARHTRADAYTRGGYGLASYWQTVTMTPHMLNIIGAGYDQTNDGPFVDPGAIVPP